MTVPYNVREQVKGVNGYGLEFSDNIQNVTLAANTDTSYTVTGAAAMGVPGNTTDKFCLVFSYGTDAEVWVRLNAAAAAPGGGAFAAGSELNPKSRIVSAGDVVHFLCVAGCNMSVSLYAVTNN